MYGAQPCTAAIFCVAIAVACFAVASKRFISFCFNALLAAVFVALRKSSAAARNAACEFESFGFVAHPFAASTKRDVASARLFAADSKRFCISESGWVSA